MADICTVIFDMDGVIIDSEPIHHKIEQEILIELGIHIPEAEHNQYIGTASIEMWTHIINVHQLDVSPHEIVTTNHQRYIQHLKSLENLPVIEGVTCLIEHLNHSGKKLVLASSSAREQIELVLGGLNIRDYFHQVVSGAELPKSKPDPMIFLEAAALVGVSPAECIVIEDSQHGVTAAKAAGMKCIGFDNPNSCRQDLSQADFITSDFTDLDIDFILEELTK